jgi:hypothetical protein
MAEDFPADVRQFIARHIESLAQLEVLLYLRQNTQRSVHPGEISNRLALNMEMSSAICADLVRRGLAIKTEASFRYQTADSELDRVAGALAITYRDRRLTVTNEIYSKPRDNVKAFAEAFRLRKEE